MAGHGKRRSRRGHDDHGEHVDERWLLTYSDLITLLMALFMVLFSISSVNKSKFESLQHALQDAFSGRILPGGKAIKEAGGTDNIANPSPSAPESSLQPYVGGKPQENTKAGGQVQSPDPAAARAAAKEQQDFQKLKVQIDQLAQAEGLSGKVQTKVTEDGLLIRVLTDDLLFDSGSAVPKPASMGLLRGVAGLLAKRAADHQLIVQGHTDTQPIHSAQFPDNWALSTARAESVVRTFAQFGIDPRRMTAAGRGEFKPLASNATAGGRTLNRRVEILVPRADKATGSGDAKAAIGDPIPSIRPDLSPGTH
jgi:chemotaxis protein MotB